MELVGTIFHLIDFIISYSAGFVNIKENVELEDGAEPAADNAEPTELPDEDLITE